MNEIGTLILMAFWPAAILMFVFWIIQVFTRNAGIVDLGWALGLMIHAGAYAFLAEGNPSRKMVLFGLVAIWAMRMAYLLIPRLLKGKEDRRYALLRKEWGPNINFKFFLLFEFEALLNVVLSIPFLIICLNPATNFHVLEILGGIIWLTGFIGEVTADQQLKVFKNNAANKGKICRDGLWDYSRHPNYFFEWLMWVGYAVAALSVPFGLIALISPLVILFLLLKVTGIPFIEEHGVKTKCEAFKEYQRTTSIFIPLPKRNVKGVN